MYVILTASDIDTNICPLSNSISKTFVPINGKPILRYILDELYSYQEYIEKIVIVKKDCSDIKNYLEYSVTDDFFKTKINCVNTSKYKNTSDPTYSILDDFYSGLEYLVDELQVEESEVLVWSADELVLNSRKLIDFDNGSFYCKYDGKDVKIYRFDNFVATVNLNILLKEKENIFSMDDFISEYSKLESISPLEDFGDYKYWQTRSDYYKIQSEMINQDEHKDYIIDIDTKKQQISKTNKYYNVTYDDYSYVECRRIQYDLFTEAEFLDLPNAEQQVFLPRIIDQDVNKCGEYTDWITEEYIPGTTLDSFLLDENLDSKNWEEIIDKLYTVITEVFHINDIEESEELWHNYVEPKLLTRSFNELQENIYEIISGMQEYFTLTNAVENNFVLSNNDIAEWKIFIERFLEKYEDLYNKDNVIYNQNCERLVHGNLTFDNIVYDAYTGKMVFINPRTRKWDIVDKNLDYASLYVSSFCGLHALLSKKYVDNGTKILLPETIAENMMKCTDVLDSYFGDNADTYKMFSVILLLDYAYSNLLETEDKVIIIRYANQLKSNYWDLLN